jgi:carbon-monoxide dehydrogenase medium subunit
MYDFKYEQAKSVADAAKAIGTDGDAKLVAGGMTLIPTLKQRLAKPSALVDLGGIAELKGIKREGNAIVIGAMTKHVEVATSADVKSAIPALADLASMIGDPAVRNRGTIGGSITNKRKIAADEFFKGMFETALGGDEIVTAVSFPIPDKAAYMKFRNPASRYAIVGTFVAKTGSNVRVGVTGAAPGVFRWKEAETALGKSWNADALKDLSVKADGLNSDIHASSEYRAHLVGVMARRAVAKAG